MNILILFGSTTGNTQMVVDMIESALPDTVNVEAHPGSDMDVIDFSDQDIVLFGSSTWGNGDIQESMQDLYDDLSPEYVDGKKVAVFGCGDSAFPLFCKAVDLFEAKLKENGADIIQDGLKVDGMPVDSQDEIEAWVSTIVE
ncbi:MAG: flavodoxin domain-containing protein [Patescibacteria group bacterium]|nr:flavodoxin domain-containing protein [Patescibacteria group bacterium]